MDEDESDKKFLEKQIEKERIINNQVKEELNTITAEYDSLYKQA